MPDTCVHVSVGFKSLNDFVVQKKSKNIVYAKKRFRNSQPPSYMIARVRNFYFKFDVAQLSVAENDTFRARPSVDFWDFLLKMFFVKKLTDTITFRTFQR